MWTTRRSSGRIVWMAGTYGSRRVLIVEDEEAAARSLARLLRRCGGPDAVLATTFMDGARELRAAEPSICAAILDIRLPGGCGLDLISVARERDPGLPILVLTGNVDHPYLANLAQVHGVEFAFKPADTEVVAAFVRRAAARPQELNGVERSPVLDAFALAHGLTAEEIEIVRLRLSGLQNKEIADARNTSAGSGFFSGGAA